MKIKVKQKGTLKKLTHPIILVRIILTNIFLTVGFWKFDLRGQKLLNFIRLGFNLLFYLYLFYSNKLQKIKFGVKINF